MSLKQLVTAERLWEIPEKPGIRYELVRGELVEVPGAGYPHARLGRALMRLLDPFVVERDLGEAFPDGLAYIIAREPDTVRIPDVSFISKGRLPQEDIEGFVPFAPDLAVEIVSPTDRAEEVYGKVREYLEAGTRTVWVFWPRYQSITVYVPEKNPRELDEDDELDGGEVLPGFRARVADLFRMA